MTLALHRYDRVDNFLGAAGEFLAAREAEHNLTLGICTAARNTPEIFGDPPLFTAVTRDGAVSMTVVQTPPWQAVLSMADDLEAVDLVADELAAAGIELPGVLGPVEAARRFAERWTAHRGATAELGLRERIFRLDRVVPPRPTSGAWRHAEERDRALLAAWFRAFQGEAVPRDPQPSDEELDAAITRWLARIGRTIYLWEDEGEIVSLVGAGGATPNGIRIGPVYTPPALRRRGYASALTAAVSQDQLDAGRRFCFLFTDLANPTSNKIYQAIGYRPVVDVDQYRFTAS